MPPKNPVAAAPPPAEPVSPVIEVATESAVVEEPAETAPPNPPGEPEIVAVGTVSHVIRRAFHHFYSNAEPPHAPLQPAISDHSFVSGDGSATTSETLMASDSQPTGAEVVHPYVARGATRKQLLQDSLALTQSTASALLSFLDERYSAAARKDEAVAEDLVRQGLVVRAQIPLGPSHLQLDPQELESFGAFADTLVHAKTLVRDYHTERLDKSGNGPTFLARKVAAIAREPPGYLTTTSSSDVRKQTTLSVHEHHIQTVKADRTESSSSVGTGATAERPGGTDTEMPAPEKRRNMAILERMQTKLDFLRNPRYAAAEASEEDASSTFVAVPSTVAFTDYDVGGVYEQTFVVRNNSRVSRRVRVLPPATLFFSMAQIVFPDATGLVAPGMHVQVKLRFAPDSRADYKDAMTIQYETTGGKRHEMELPVVARRTPPELSIPLLLRAQPTLVGSQSITEIPCQNTGGKARFWLMSERDWAACEATTALRMQSASFQAQHGPLRIGPFTVSPRELELATGESVTLQLTFLPSGVGEMRDKLVMVCDNCLVRVFQLVGRGCQVEVSVSSLNDHAVERTIASIGRVGQVVFPSELLLNATATQRFSVLNDTPINLPFTWRLETSSTETTSGHSRCPFQISPSTGMLPQSDSASFSVSFTPHSARRFSHWRLVLFINDVPACCIPGPNQLALISVTLARLHQRLGEGPGDQVTAAEPTVECMRLALHGTGRLGDFHLNPCTIGVAAADPQTPELLLGSIYHVATRVWNDCDAVVRVRWDPSRAQFTSGGGSRGLFQLVIPHEEVDITARSHMDVTIAFTPLAVGRFAIVVPCAIVDPHALDRSASMERWLRLEGCVAQPQLRIVSPEIDFGLVLASGASADATLTLRNDSRVATGDWMLVHLEAPAAKANGDDMSDGTVPLSSATSCSTLHRANSKDSLCSRTSGEGGAHSSARSSSGLFSSRDLAPRASVSFSPPTGSLAPFETVDVRVTCLSGSLPERFRGTFAVRPVPTTLPPVFPCSLPLPQSLVPTVSARAEIQSPNVFLTPLRLTLGATFLGVCVERELQLVNVSNLAADFKFVEPQGPSKACTVDVSPRQGLLHSKQTLAVRIRYTPRQAGKTTTLLACSVKGLSGPLGLELVATHKGLVLTYDVVPLDEKGQASRALPLAPHTLAQARGVSVDDGDLEPDGNGHSLPKLLFGDEIPLAQRRTLRLVVRNFSGIDAQLEFEMKRFPAAAAAPSSPLTSPMGPRGTSIGSSTRTSSRKKTKPPLLSDAKDNSRRFQSDPGRAYIRGQEFAQQDRALLRDGRGAAFLVSSPSSSLETLEQLAALHVAPWEAAVVDVTCINNMPGTYSDVLSCRAAGLPPVLLPVLATVVGTPLVLDTHCVGLHVPKASKTKPATFSFGHVCVGSPAVTRTLRVLNRGPRAATLAWKLVDPKRENQRVQLTLHVDAAARVRLGIVPLSDDSSQLPFTITPSHSQVAPFASVSVSVTFVPTTHVTPAARAMLIADAHWIDDQAFTPPSQSSSLASLDQEHRSKTPGADLPADPRCEPATPSTSSPLPSARLATAAGKAIQAVRVANSLSRTHSPSASKVSDAKCIRVLLCAAAVAPELFLDTPPSACHGVRFTTWSTLLDSDAAWHHAYHRRAFSLTNHLNTRLTFRLEASGPFAVTRAESLAPRHPLAVSDLPPAHRRADGESFLFTLPPQMAVRVELRVDPSKLQPHNSRHEASALQYTVDGELLVRFTNQSVQTLRLGCVVFRPRLVVSPSVYSFGRVYLAHTRSLIVRVANPTRVPAAFRIRHVPRPTPLSRAQRQEMATHHAHFVDEPSVFTFATETGVVRGPTVSLRSAGGAPQPATNSTRDLSDQDQDAAIVKAPLEICVTFRPREIGRRYKSRFRLCVDHGVDCELVLEGQGHLDEVSYADQDRAMVRASELTHANLIFKTLTSAKGSKT